MFVTFWRDLLSRDNLNLSCDNLNLSRDNSQFIARYENVSSVSSMGHRTSRTSATDRISLPSLQKRLTTPFRGLMMWSHTSFSNCGSKKSYLEINGESAYWKLLLSD